jgi:hypothetical protein
VVSAGAGEPKREQAAVAGLQGKSSVPGLNASSHVTGAASGLSPYQLCERRAGDRAVFRAEAVFKTAWFPLDQILVL